MQVPHLLLRATGTSSPISSSALTLVQGTARTIPAVLSDVARDSCPHKHSTHEDPERRTLWLSDPFKHRHVSDARRQQRSMGTGMSNDYPVSAARTTDVPVEPFRLLLKLALNNVYASIAVARFNHQTASNRARISPTGAQRGARPALKTSSLPRTSRSKKFIVPSCT